MKTYVGSFYCDGKALKVVEKKFIMHLINEGDEWDIVPNKSTTVYLIVLQGMAIAFCELLNCYFYVEKTEYIVKSNIKS